MSNKNYGPATEKAIQEVADACEKHGNRAIVALSGVPGTGKSFIASIAAQRFANEPLLVREIQFHQSFSYEEFIEGLRIDDTSGVTVMPGVFLDWNQRALDDPKGRYVLLIEEFTRANLAAVLGELMTYLEHRDRPFVSMYSRKPVFVAKNLTLLATFNPTDRTAIDLDSALIRRLRIIRFSPSTDQLKEMLAGRSIGNNVVAKLQQLFDECQRLFSNDYNNLMPFGHGIFADIQNESPDLFHLWQQRIEHLLRRPLIEPHPFTEAIENLYPWRKKDFVLDAANPHQNP
jgi:5-methylcytosine-specific restriction endonuclease McrBC GTP-binding regulatory subunit McrB